MRLIKLKNGKYCVRRLVLQYLVLPRFQYLDLEIWWLDSVDERPASIKYGFRNDDFGRWKPAYKCQRKTGSRMRCLRAIVIRKLRKKHNLRIKEGNKVDQKWYIPWRWR